MDNGGVRFADLFISIAIGDTIIVNYQLLIISYFSQKEKQITKNLQPGLLFVHFYSII